MSPLPTGTVTFLFTDIEGSTALWERHRDLMQAALAQHHALLHAAIETHAGHVFNIVGDAFCAAFATATAGLAAAVAAQRSLRDAAWRETPLRVRMGLHTGSAEAGGHDYRSGPVLNRVARVMAQAHGGQILLSQTTADLVRGEATGVTLRDMGLHHLKGLLNPEHLWQVVAPDLPADFPPLQSLAAIPHNLPVQLTSFVGRERELHELKQILPTTRLLTLTGSGGTGKTRLSLQVAAEVLDDYKDGVWFVELAPLSDPALLPLTVASVLGVREEPGCPLLATLLDWLRPKQLLFVLDNCEHLIEACAHFADAVLHAGREARILASSREALGIAGELAWRVPSLPTPNPGEAMNITQLEQFAAVRLFIERAKFAHAAFVVTAANASGVAQICYRLDGIPLAIELAAARVKAMRVEQIAERLDDRFRLLTGGSRTALPRQQTLRGMIDWSHSLLSEPERILLRRLSVFAGGWTLEAAEAVCSDAGQDGILPHAGQDAILSYNVLDLLTHLVDKSLVVLDEQAGEPRYRMLETIRQYTREKLLVAGEGELVRTRHLEFCVRLAEAFESNFMGPEQARWLNALETEHDNVRAAIEWSLQSGSALSGMRLAAGLYWFWQQRYTGEGAGYLQALLLRPEVPPRSLERARALYYQAALPGRHGDRTVRQRSMQEVLAIAREAGHAPLIADSLSELGNIARNQKEYVVARALLTEALENSRKLNNHYQTAHALYDLGQLAHEEGDHERARMFYEESCTLLRRVGEKAILAAPLRRLGQLAIGRGDYKHADTLIEDSLMLNREIGDKRGIAACLAAWAAGAAAQCRAISAVRLCGAADILLESMHAHLLSFDAQQYDQTVASLHDLLDPATFNAAWEAGRSLTLDQAIALATDESAVNP